jgi:death on curing protein
VILAVRPFRVAQPGANYPTIWGKAAALMESLSRNRAFVDGNKRTAWRAACMFLEINGVPLAEPLDVDAAEMLVLAMAQGHLDAAAAASELVKFGASGGHNACTLTEQGLLPEPPEDRLGER